MLEVKVLSTEKMDVEASVDGIGQRALGGVPGPYFGH